MQLKINSEFTDKLNTGTVIHKGLNQPQKNEPAYTPARMFNSVFVKGI